VSDGAQAALRDGFLDLIRRRRVSRRFSPEPVSEHDLWAILEAARRAASAANVRIHRFLVVQDPERIHLVRLVSPGMLAEPTALIVICTDLDAVAAAQVQVDRDTSVLIDVGTAAMNMMLAAEALGLGSCPLTSFSGAAVREVLDLPPHARSDFILQLGHPEPERRVLPKNGARAVTAADLAYWERYGRRHPDGEERRSGDPGGGSPGGGPGSRRGQRT
jgi:nitroreductase